MWQKNHQENAWSWEKFKDYCKHKEIEIESVHTSGHATIEDLQAFANALKPKTLIPIHTFERERYSSLFANVKILDDGEEENIKWIKNIP